MKRKERANYKDTDSIIAKVTLLHYDFKCKQSMKMFVGDALYRLHIEADQDGNDVFLFTFLQYLNTLHVYKNYKYLAQNLYTH